MKYLLLVYLLSGCAALPDTVGPFVQHDSHIVQHFGNDKTDYGANLVGIDARWEWGNLYADVAEMANAQGKRPGGYGEIDGPRENFEARIGYRFKVREP